MVFIFVLVLCHVPPTPFILLTPNSPSRAHIWRAFAARTAVLPYCRTAGLPDCRTVVLSYCRACKQHGPVERASSVHREDEAGWGIGYSSEAVAGRAGPSWGQAPLAVFGVPFCCCEMLHKRDKVPGKDAFRRPSRRVDFAKLCAKSPQSPQYGLNSSSFAVASSPY